MKIVGKEIIADEGKYLCRKSDAGFNMPFTRGILLRGESEDDFVELDHKPEPIPEPEPSYDQQVVSLIRECYSADDELAIIRQRDTKPEEFEQYFNYCEACKAKVKQKLGMV